MLAAAPQGTGNDPAAASAILAVYALTQQYGGADTLEPGMSQLLTTDFSAGNYLAVDESADQPVLKTFTVAGPSIGVRALQADFVVAEGEFFYGAPHTVKAGTNVVKVTNVGYQVHMLVLARLDPGYTAADVLTLINGDTNGPPPDWLHPGPGMVDLSPGLTVYTTLTLDPGLYVLFCFEPDATTGQPHAVLGMNATFTAQ